MNYSLEQENRYYERISKAAHLIDISAAIVTNNQEFYVEEAGKEFIYCPDKIQVVKLEVPYIPAYKRRVILKDTIIDTFIDFTQRLLYLNPKKNLSDEQIFNFFKKRYVNYIEQPVSRFIDYDLFYSIDIGRQTYTGDVKAKISDMVFAVDSNIKPDDRITIHNRARTDYKLHQLRIYFEETILACNKKISLKEIAGDTNLDARTIKKYLPELFKEFGISFEDEIITKDNIDKYIDRYNKNIIQRIVLERQNLNLTKSKLVQILAIELNLTENRIWQILRELAA